MTIVCRMKKILVTGAAGFIGFHLVNRLLTEGYDVIGLDNINDYYDTRLKYGRLELSGIKKSRIVEKRTIESDSISNYRFIKADLKDHETLNQLFDDESFTHVINLAAQAGVRYSIENPRTYIVSNIVGFANILEACRHHKIKHLTYASSSSVYGLNENMPFSTEDNVDHPISLYAASKKSNELMAHTYSHLYGLPTTGLRFFTVYGPWGRPDMAYYLFTKAIVNNESIKVFNDGNMSRDFTYVSDIVEGILRVCKKAPTRDTSWTGKNPNPSTSRSPYAIYNIGNNSPVNLMEFISTIEKHLGLIAKKEYMPIQPGDVVSTYADVKGLENDFGYKPVTSLNQGIGEFVNWYKAYYRVG